MRVLIFLSILVGGAVAFTSPASTRWTASSRARAVTTAATPSMDMAEVMKSVMVEVPCASGGGGRAAAASGNDRHGEKYPCHLYYCSG